MDKFDVSLRILKEVLDNDISSNEDILSKTQNILASFEQIYKKISELEASDSRITNERSQLSLVLEEATERDDYERFRAIMTSRISEHPELLDCLDCSKDTIEAVKSSFSEPTFRGLRTAIQPLEIRLCSKATANGCPFERIAEALNINERFGDFRQAIRDNLSAF